MKKRLGVAAMALGAALQAPAQTKLDLRTQGRNVDFAAASSTRPAKTGVNAPASCTTGELFFKSDAVAGRNLYGCTEANVWTPLSGAMLGSGCGLVGCETGLCSIDSNIIPSYTGPLASGALIVGGGESFVRAITPGTAGQVLVSSGPGTDPSWNDWPGSGAHVTLTGLDYASSGHTGFQAELGFTPERQLTFAAPFQRSGDTISCPGCGTGAGAGTYAASFTAALSVSVPGSTHGLGADLHVAVFDAASPRQVVEPDAITIDAATGDVMVTFAVPQSGRLILR